MSSDWREVTDDQICSAVDEKVRQAEEAVKQVHREMWRPIWGPFALPEPGVGH
jgi:hypothetical protein